MLQGLRSEEFKVIIDCFLFTAGLSRQACNSFKRARVQSVRAAQCCKKSTGSCNHSIVQLLIM